MPRSLHPNSVIPRGLVVDHVEVGTGLTITARPVATLARCPSCDRPSSRIHNRYTRTLSDLPVAGRPVVIDVSVRRFRCVGIDCRTRNFAERLGLSKSVGTGPWIGVQLGPLRELGPVRLR